MILWLFENEVFSSLAYFLAPPSPQFDSMCTNATGGAIMSIYNGRLELVRTENVVVAPTLPAAPGKG